MSKSPQMEGVTEIIKQYFLSPSIQRELAARLLKIAALYARKHWEHKFLHQAFAIFRTAKKETFVSAAKRLLHLLDEILGKDEETDKPRAIDPQNWKQKPKDLHAKTHQTQPKDRKQREDKREDKREDRADLQGEKSEHRVQRQGRQQLISRREGQGYGAALSEVIVEYYSYIFAHIFEFKAHELISDFKLYRFRWAKRISDQSFMALRSQILKQFKFDLNKGIPPESLQKIRKRYIKRGFTEQQIQKYLGNKEEVKKIEPYAVTSHNAKQQSEIQQSSSQQQQQQYGRKMVKREPSPYLHQPYQYYPPSYPQQYPNTQSYAPQNYPPQPAPQNYPQHYPFQYQSIHPPSIYHPQTMHPPSGYLPSQPYYQAPSGYYPPASTDPRRQAYNRSSPLPGMQMSSMPLSMHAASMQASIANQAQSQNARTPSTVPSPKSLSYSPIPQPSSPQALRQIQLTKQPEIASRIVELSSSQQMLSALRQLPYECKQCGMRLLFKTNYEEHLKKHFLEKQKKYIAKELSSKSANGVAVKRQPNIPSLLTAEEWIMRDRAGEQQMPRSVQIDPSQEPPLCLFCHTAPVVAFSEQMDSWALMNCVRVKLAGKGEEWICHYDCYEGFCQEDDDNRISIGT